MGLSCGCPAPDHLPDLEIPDCKESLGQVQKIIFQRVYKTAGEKNSITDPTTKASWTSLFSAADSTKTLITPFIGAPTTEPGAARTFGGGNQTRGGIEIIIGREPTTFSAMFYQESQRVMTTLKQLQCENIGVYLVDEFGNIGCLADNPKTPTKYMPIPIGKFFIGDKKLGGYEDVDSNIMEWSFFPNWSDNLVIVTPTDFNPLDDLANEASA